MRLTGLSSEQLREWTIRRALIPADIKPKGHGSPARFSWQTILLLRLAATLRDHFKVELQAHRELFANLRASLGGVSFISLWGKSLALYGAHDWKILDREDNVDNGDDLILLRLDSHLKILSAGFALPQPSASPGQFQLFPAQGVVADNRWRR